jgi:hypothetical protein
MIFCDVPMRSLAQMNKPGLEISPQDGIDQVNRQRAEINSGIGLSWRHGCWSLGWHPANYYRAPVVAIATPESGPILARIYGRYSF